MYVYIYDDFTNQSKFSKLLYKIETRLTDLGLNGKIVRLGVSKNLTAVIENELRQGVKTFVAVGNDQTVSKVASALANNQSDEKNRVSLGIISLQEKESKIAELLGIKNINDACDVLLARRIETFNLARANNDFFIFNAQIEAPDTILEIDKNYIIQNMKPAIVEIINSPTTEESENSLTKKGLELKIKEKNGQSLFCFQELIIVNKDAPLRLDWAREIKTPAKIMSSNEIIKIIVGRKRTINESNN